MRMLSSYPCALLGSIAAVLFPTLLLAQGMKVPGESAVQSNVVSLPRSMHPRNGSPASKCRTVFVSKSSSRG